MNCLESLDLLQRRLDGERAFADRPALDAHLASCPECRARHATALRLEEGLRVLPRAVPPPDFARRIGKEVLRERAGRQFRRRLVVGFALAASLLLAAVGGYLWLMPRDNNLLTARQKRGQDQATVKTDVPSLPKVLGEARQALAGLAAHAGEQVQKPAQVLRSAALPTPFVTVAVLPYFGSEKPPHDPTPQAVSQVGNGVSRGLTPVAVSARRALNYFLRKQPPLPTSPRS